ncbi:MAG: thioredoxin [Eubacterium sp.]|nr:thioredoxin [Eubacterium sp.]
MAVVTITMENFETEVLKSDQPVIVDFWADWCGPCKRLSPAVEELSNETSSVKIGKVNVDEQPELASKFQVMSIPTLIAFKNGKVYNTSVGLIPKNAILDLVK